MKTELDGDVPTVPLVSIIYREHAKYLNEKVKDEGLSFGIYPLLIKAYKHEGIIQEELAEAFHLNESTITRNLNKLEDKGLIKRVPDKRTKIIKVTDEGEKIAKKVMGYDEQWDEKIKDIIGIDEFNDYKRILKKIHGGLI